MFNVWLWLTTDKIPHSLRDARFWPLAHIILSIGQSIMVTGSRLICPFSFKVKILPCLISSVSPPCSLSDNNICTAWLTLVFCPMYMILCSTVFCSVFLPILLYHIDVFFLVLQDPSGSHSEILCIQHLE